MENKKVYQAIAENIGARMRCQSPSANESQKEWIDTWRGIATGLTDLLPSGSGWDNGTKIDLDNSHSQKLVFYGAYHHMNDNGFYDGWTDHTITVTPSFNGINIRISGRNRNDIKDYLYELFESCLCQFVEWDKQTANYKLV